MKYQDYYSDIRSLPQQLKKGIQIAKSVSVKGSFNKIISCGMGGSSLFNELINNYFSYFNINMRIIPSRSYSLPWDTTNDDLVLVISHSGNTEETISSYKEVLETKLTHCVFTTGGKLHKFAKANNSPLVTIPKGIQPRLSTGYFISSILTFLANSNIITCQKKYLSDLAGFLNNIKVDEYGRMLAKKLKNKVPILYASDNNHSIARIGKIKLNENAKIQSFWNFFPELNHNEMQGFEELIMNPFFLIFKSKYTHKRNHERINVFSTIIKTKGLEYEIIEMDGNDTIQEIMSSYVLIDHIAFHLAVDYGYNPEEVKMVEDFKEMLD